MEASKQRSDLPSEIVTPATWPELLVSVAGTAALLLAAYLVLTWHAGAGQPEAGHDTPTMRNFFAKVDFRYIELFTVDQARVKDPGYRFDSFGFRLDRYDCAFGQPAGPKQIWMLGNSVAMGMGVHENETIAAHLNTRLVEAGLGWRVLNLAQGGYTSNQELLLLIELLQNGHRPDALLVYNGIGEFPSAGGWETGTARAKFVDCIRTHRPSGGFARFAVGNLTNRLDSWWPLKYDITENLGDLRRGERDASGEGDDWDPTIQRYLTNLTVMKSVADSHKIPAFFIYQPVMWYEKHYRLRQLSEREEGMLPWAPANEYQRREALYQEKFAALREVLGDRLLDFYDVFRGLDGETLYRDARHTNGHGNKIIADRIYLECLDALTR
jgi:hypothetical protein